MDKVTFLAWQFVLILGSTCSIGIFLGALGVGLLAGGYGRRDFPPNPETTVFKVEQK